MAFLSPLVHQKCWWDKEAGGTEVAADSIKRTEENNLRANLERWREREAVMHLGAAGHIRPHAIC